MEELFNEAYYSKGCGYDYKNREVWLKHFEDVADRIVSDFKPKTVIDVGCAMGYLVEALRDRGVEAYGVDISRYAIDNVREDIKQYCYVVDLTKGIPEKLNRKFDVLTSIEMIEHAYEEDSLEILKSLCKLSDNILFSSSYEDIIEKTHFNVQLPEYWAKNFEKHGYYRVLNYRADYISSQAVMFKKQSLTSNRIVEDYERTLRINSLDIINKTNEFNKINENKDLIIKSKDEYIKGLGNALKEKDKYIIELDEKLKEKDKYINELKNSMRIINDDLNNKRNLIKDKNYQINWLNESIIEKIKKFDYVKELIQILKIRNVESDDKKTKELTLKRGAKNIEVDNIKKENDKLKRLINEKDKRINELYNLAEQRIQQIQNQECKLNRIISDLEFANYNYNTTINSKSWKVTAPMRNLIGVFKKKPQMQQNGGIMRHKQEEANSQPILCEEKNNTVSKTLIKRFRNANKISALYTEDGVKRLNLVTDSLGKNSLFGGVATSLIIATIFCNENDIPLRIITRNEKALPENYNNIIELNKLKMPKEVCFYSDFDRDLNGKKSYSLDVSKEDIFFATSWWSAEAIRKTTLRNRFFYLIQEVETFFYPHGEDHYVCNEIMENKNIDFIINSKYLYDYFKTTTPNIIDNGIYFNPAFTKSMYIKPKFKKKEKYKLFMYARPNNPRNMYHIGIKLLDYCILNGIIDTKQWEICFAGSEMNKIEFCDGTKPTLYGVLEWKEYLQFINEVDLAVSLMYTPHPSYPPFDIVCAGGVVVTNKYKNKIDFNQSQNVLITDLKEESFSKTIQEAVSLAQNMTKRKSNYENSTIPDNWNSTLINVLKFMKDRV